MIEEYGSRVTDKDNELWGFKKTDLLGIAIMIIPFFISFIFRKELPPKKILFITTKAGNFNDTAAFCNSSNRSCILCSSYGKIQNFQSCNS